MKSSFSYFDQPHSFSTFLQSKQSDLSGHDYGNVVYSPLCSTTAETIMEENEGPSKNVSQVLGASAIRCMTEIACSLATSSPDDHEEDEKFESNKVRFDDAYCAEDVHFEEVENSVQQLFNSMPDYTNVTVSDQSPCKYTPLQQTF